MKTAITLVLLALSYASPLRAELKIGLTAEWLSHESSLVALATPVDVRNIETSDHLRWTKCRYRLDEIIKGPESVGDTVTVFERFVRNPEDFSLDKPRKVRTQVLVFATVAEHLHNEIDGKYVLLQTDGLNSATVYLTDQPVKDLYTPDFKVLVKFDELLRRVLAQTAHESELKRQRWQGKVQKKSLEAPFDSEAYKQLYAGSACYLWVPEFVATDRKIEEAKP